MTNPYFKIWKCLFSRGAETSPSIGADLVDFPQKENRRGETQKGRQMQNLFYFQES